MTGQKKPGPQKASPRKNTVKSATKAAEKKAKMKTTPIKLSPAKFIDAIENPTRKKDAKILLSEMKKITGEKPVMWGASIVGYGTYHYKYESGREGDMLAVGFSPRKANMVLYVLGSLGADEPLLKKLGKYKNGKSCLYINKLDDVDVDVLKRIILKSYKTTKKNWG